MFTRTKSKPIDDRANPFRDPTFRPKMTTFKSPEFRRSVESIIDRYAAAATEPVSSATELPAGGHPGDILQLDENATPQWLRKLTVSESSPSDAEGEDGDLWIQTIV